MPVVQAPMAAPEGERQPPGSGVPRGARGNTPREQARKAVRAEKSLRINGLSAEPPVTVMDRAHATGKHEGLIFAAERLLAAMTRYRDKDGPYVALRLAQDEIMAEIDRMRAAGEIP